MRTFIEVVKALLVAAIMVGSVAMAEDKVPQAPPIAAPEEPSTDEPEAALPADPVPLTEEIQERLAKLQKRIEALNELQASLKAEGDRLFVEQLESGERTVGELEAEGERVRSVEFPAIVKKYKLVELAFKQKAMGEFTALTQEFDQRSAALASKFSGR